MHADWQDPAIKKLGIYSDCVDLGAPNVIIQIMMTVTPRCSSTIILPYLLVRQEAQDPQQSL